MVLSESSILILMGGMNVDENSKKEIDERVENALLEAEQHAKSDPTRLDNHTVFSNLRKSIVAKSSKERER